MTSKEMFDVIIVGAGYAGLSAALEAGKTGASVVVLCDRGQLANNSAMSGGLFAMVNTPVQAEKGIKDSAELFAQDIMKASQNRANAEIVKIAANASHEMYDWLTALGAKFPTLSNQSGHSVLRVHQEIGETGGGFGRGGRLIKLMHEAAKANGVDIRMHTPVTGLLTDKNGRVTGAIAKGESGDMEITARHGVVLAAGGFAKNQPMLAKYVPAVVGMSTNSAAGSTGDGIRMGIATGAGTVNLDAIVMSCTVSATTANFRELGAVMRFGLAEGIAVNKEGIRFMDETVSGYTAASYLMRQTGKIAYVIFDDETKNKAKLSSDEGMLSAAAPEELGVKLGIDGRTLAQTISAYNQAVPKVDAFGHPSQKRPLRGVLSAMAFTGNMIMTYGGLMTNTNTQVLRDDGSVIPGLFAAGDNASGLCGPATGSYAAPGYLTGCGNLAALVFGRIAGRNVVKG